MKTGLIVTIVGLLALSCAGAHAGPKVLYWSDLDVGVNPFPTAFSDLGWDVTTAYDEYDYNTQLGAGGWDLTTLLLQNSTYGATVFTNLPTYISGGGKAIYTDWTRNATRGSWFGVTYTANTNQATIALTAPWLQTGMASTTFQLTNPGWGTFSMGMALSGATSGATFANGDVAIAYTGNTIINGWLKDTALYPAEGLQLAKNEIGYLHDGGPVTPELSSASLLLAGMLPMGLAWWRRRKQ